MQELRWRKTLVLLGHPIAKPLLILRAQEDNMRRPVLGSSRKSGSSIAVSYTNSPIIMHKGVCVKAATAAAVLLLAIHRACHCYVTTMNIDSYFVELTGTLDRYNCYPV